MKFIGKILTVAVFLAVVSASSYALAAHLGTVCRHFPGPDGPKYVQQAKACVTIDDHDFDDRIRGYATFFNNGRQRVQIHFSYVKLLHLDGGDVWTARYLPGFTFTLRPGELVYVATGWRENPQGAFWTRERMWVCWIDLPGKPCGSPVAWNSQEVAY